MTRATQPSGRLQPRTADRRQVDTLFLWGVNALSAATFRSLSKTRDHAITFVHDAVLDDADARRAGLVGLGLNVDPSVVRVLSDPAHVEPAPGDVVVATCPYGRADRLEEIGRAVRASGALMLPVWLEQFTVHVGPIALPTEVGCLHCYSSRRAANDERPELQDALRRHATQSPEGRRSTGFVPPLVDMVGALCAAEVGRLAAGAEPVTRHAVIEVDLVQCSSALRTVLPVPGCPGCASSARDTLARDADGARADGVAPAGRLLESWDALVDSSVGIVRSVTPLPIDEDEPDFVHYLSKACSTDQLGQLRNFSSNGGVGVDHTAAAVKAVGEAVERYCSAFFGYEDLVVASFSELPSAGTHPESFALYQPEQYASGDIPWRPFGVDTPVTWTTGNSLRSGEPVYVPAAMVHVPFHYRAGLDSPICQPISTGLAAGGSFADAALSGLCEAIERDAFTITWQAMLSHPRIAGDTLPSSSQDRVDRFTRVGVRVEIMDITTDLGVPTMLTIAIGERTTSPAVAVAAATDPSAEVALNKSLDELAHTRKFARQVMDYTPALAVDVAGGHPEVLDQHHHLRFYCPQTARAFAEFAWASPDERPFVEPATNGSESSRSRLGAVVDKVAEAGLDVIACDLTTADVAQLGLSTVRVVVPGLHPLFMGHRNRALGGSRLYEVPARLGLRGIRPGEPDNPYPHPFP